MRKRSFTTGAAPALPSHASPPRDSLSGRLHSVWTAQMGGDDLCSGRRRASSSELLCLLGWTISSSSPSMRCGEAGRSSNRRRMAELPRLDARSGRALDGTGRTDHPCFRFSCDGLRKRRTSAEVFDVFRLVEHE